MHPYRILLDPAGGEGGAEAAPEIVTIPRVEPGTTSEVDGVSDPHPAPAEAEGRQAEREADASRQIAELDRKAAEWEHAYKAALRDRELAMALAGKPLIPGAAVQLIKLWQEEFDVYEDEGRPRVASRDGLAVEKAVAELLSRPEYAHFRPPTSRGGTAAQGSNRNAAAPAVPPAGRTLGESVVQRWREASVARGSDPAAPVGLGRRR